jgi:RHS repeat-associated protein
VLTVLHRDDAGHLVALQRGAAWFYVATDQVGSPRVVSDAAGTAVKVVRYDAFGAVIADSAPAFELPVGFAGGVADPATGLILFGLRDYEPASGRWVARDPILFDGGQGNLYAYAGNDPVGRRDPVGLACIAVSEYAGAGGGVQTCIDDTGVTVCFETGFGLGADISGDWDGKAEESGHAIGLQGEAALGPASAGADLSLDNHGCLKLTPGAEVGPVTLGPDGFGWQLEVEDAPDYAVKGTRVKLQGKLYGKKCFNRKF